MGKAAGCSPCGGCGKCGIGSSARAGAKMGNTARGMALGNYNFGRMPNFMSSMTNYTGLFNRWEEMQKAMGKGTKYELKDKRAHPYETVGPLEAATYSVMAAKASVDYSGKHKVSYSANAARGADKGYGGAIKGDSYQTPNIINFADYKAGMLDRAYKKTNGEGYQPKRDYGMAA